MRCVACFVIVLALNAHAWKIEYTETGQEEGDECHREAGNVWRCQKDADCEGLKEVLRVNGKLKTCSWKERTPILCCPPKKELTRIQPSKSEERCAGYGKILCGDQTGIFMASQAQPSLQRRKRQDLKEADIDTTYDQTPVLAVFGGITSKSGEFPSMALIGYGDPGVITWQCGGSLISENFVLSAAHCVNTPYGLARWVRLGDLDLKSDTEEARPQELEIVERVVHPGYKAPAFYNDLALFRLSRPADFDRFVRPACLHTDLRDPPGWGTAAGWGKNETNGPRSSALQQVDISFVPAEDCIRTVGVINKYLPNGVNPDTMVCAGELGKDTCQGDSGGPLILPSTPWSTTDCLAKLVGVTSFGPRNCGVTSVPGAYVRVAYFNAWIESIVWPE